jgi:hypothetical protein
LPPLVGGGAAFDSIAAFRVLPFAMEAHTLRVSVLPPLAGGGAAFNSIAAFRVLPPASAGQPVLMRSALASCR